MIMEKSVRIPPICRVVKFPFEGFNLIIVHSFSYRTQLESAHSDRLSDWLVKNLVSKDCDREISWMKTKLNTAIRKKNRTLPILQKHSTLYRDIDESKENLLFVTIICTQQPLIFINICVCRNAQ